MVRDRIQLHRVSCSEIWGGIQNVDLDACTASLILSVYSSACDGGKGGDIYYLSQCDTDRLTRIALADVVGHGQAVVEVSQWVYDLLAQRMNNREGDGILTDLNRRIARRGFDAITTATVVGFWTADSNLYFAYAGHPPLLVRRRDDPEWSVLEPDERMRQANLPLGVNDDLRYVQKQMPLVSGDRLLLYTDGLIEAADAAGVQFGQGQLLAALRSAPDGDLSKLKTHVLEAVRRHVGGPLRHDDVTLMAIEVR